jgi:hypothetical protein
MKRPRAAILPILLGLWPCLPLACHEDEPERPGETPPPPATTDASTGPALTSDDTAGIPVACGCLSGDATRDDCPCPAGQACAADYALGDPPPDAFTCRPECIPAGEPLLWCLHVPGARDQGAGCCSGVCRADGLCGAPEGTDDTSTGTETGTSTGTETGTSTGTETGTSTGSETGTSTGAGSTTAGTSTGPETGTSTGAGTSSTG